MLTREQILTSSRLKDVLDLERKLDLYEAGMYMFSVPGVTTANWDTISWINHIDKCGKWDEGDGPCGLCNGRMDKGDSESSPYGSVHPVCAHENEPRT